MRPLPWLLAILLALVIPTAGAEFIQYSALLSGAAEAPPNVSPGTGSVLVTIDTDADIMRIEADFSGLLGTTTAAHIHCCTAVPGTGIAGVATQTPSFAGFPLGVTSGSFDNTFDMDLLASFNGPFVTANGGTADSAFAALLAGLDGGQAYFNIHSSFAGGGEIRGFLARIPEPSALWLSATALCALLLTRRRGRA
jgi:hypothetical protein